MGRGSLYSKVAQTEDKLCAHVLCISTDCDLQSTSKLLSWILVSFKLDKASRHHLCARLNCA